MISDRDKYRNPPAPVGYVQTAEPTLTKKKAAYEDDPMYILLQELLDAKVYEIPDITIYEEFIINPSSDDEIEEVPFVPVPKVVDTVDITADNDEPDIVPSINIKKERVSPEPPAVTKDSEQTTAKESSLLAKESETQKQKKKSHSRRKKKHKKGSYSYSSDNDSLSESNVDDGDSKKKSVGEISDESRSPTKKKKDYVSKKKSRRKSHRKKKRNYSSDSDTHSRSDGSRSLTRKKEDYVSERKSRSKSHHRKKSNYSSGSDSHSRSDGSRSPTRKKEDYVSERKSRSKSHHGKKSNYSSGSDSYSRKHRRISSARSRSGSRHRHKKEYSSYSDEDRDYKKRERHSYKKLHAKDERQSDFQEDDTDQDSKYLASSFLMGHQVSKKESLQNTDLEPNFLHGDYYCKVCNVSANNELTYESHLKGKKHKKNVESQQKEARREATLAKHPDLIKAEEISNEAPNNPLLSQPASKYPEPPVGYYRKKMDIKSVIQNFLDNSAKFPCPGLHKVTEIRGRSETVYYCAICDCNCSYNSIIQHLGGFKHQLNSLKYYRSELYDMWNYKPKFVIQDKVISVLYKEQEKHGKGFVQVEKDCQADTQNAAEAVRTDPYIDCQPSTSYQPSDTDFYETYKHNSLPDPTKAGYYCKLCDSHSNSESMWNAHIIGKRHLANLKKNPGIAPSKSKYIRAERNVRPILFDIIMDGNVDDLPVVGLSQIREIRKQDISGVLFTCFLCGSSIPRQDVLDHVLSTRHREKYLISIKHPEMETVKNLQVSESNKRTIIQEICEKVQEELGMGTPDVFFAKR